MSENAIRRTDWGSTALLAIVMLIALGVAKLIGAPRLFVQRFPHLKEWVYAGFAFDFGGEIVSHTVAGYTLPQTFPAMFRADPLAVSYGAQRTRESRLQSTV